jgi:hypothetical protein
VRGSDAISDVVGYQCCGSPCCLHLHSVRTQKTTTLILFLCMQTVVVDMDYSVILVYYQINCNWMREHGTHTQNASTLCDNIQPLLQPFLIQCLCMNYVNGLLSKFKSLATIASRQIVLIN